MAIFQANHKKFNKKRPVQTALRRDWCTSKPGPNMDDGLIKNVKIKKSDFQNHWILIFFWWFSWIVFIAGLLSSLLSFCMIGMQNLELPEQVLRCHGIILGLIVAAVEMGHPQMFRMLGILESWMFRGLYLSFVAALLMCFGTSGNGFFDMVRLGTGYALLGCGVFYFLSGVLCLRQVYSKTLWSLQRKTALHQEKEYLQKRKSEIEKLLGDTEVKIQHL